MDTDIAGQSQAFGVMQPWLAMTPYVQTTGAFGQIGRVRWHAGVSGPGYGPRAEGQLLDVSSNQALFSVLGTTYGGDGRATFGLPDLRGRAMVGVGGATRLGQTAGAVQRTLLDANLPAHTHDFSSGRTTTSVGGGQPFSVKMPTLAINHEIAVTGIFPSSSLAAPGSNVIGGFDPAIAEIQFNAGVYSPSGRSFLNAQGQTLSINSNQALFSLLGCAYGGDCRTDFDLPDTAGRVIVGTGRGAGLANRVLGTERGQSQVSLSTAEMPHHSHGIPGETGSGTGGGRPVSLVQEELSLNWVINMVGLYPTDGIFGSGEPVLGEVSLFAGNFAPRGTAFANGQILSIASNTALFSLLGCAYGGDCETTFALPDLRGRTPIGAGTFVGGQTYSVGQRGGAEQTVLTTANLPAHSHRVAAVPVPQTAFFLLAGMGLLGLARSRRRRPQPLRSTNRV
ncbi:tail fiber protein [Aliiruegeria haliotis]|uniref:phage tail protein n=1 Tax=Aliiruegeria haliotis TaxID=1280846 RepID=UPI001B803384